MPYMVIGLEFASQRFMYFMFLSYFIIFVFAFTINLTDKIFPSTVGLLIIFNCY